MLSSRCSQTSFSSQQPVLVFLHGLLGSGSDWQPVLEHIDLPWITVDLPGHGLSQSVSCSGFEDCCTMVAQVVMAQLGSETPCYIVGYSLGARIAMVAAASGAFSELNVKGWLIEGGNFGLIDEEAKQTRWVNDTNWATRFEQEPLEQVLSDWYQQPVFSSLNHEQRQIMITKRSDNLGNKVAEMLRATSLAKQPYLLSTLKTLTLPMHYLCGERDAKFRQLAQQSGLQYSQIAQAGHNVHQEQPLAYAAELQQFIRQHCGS
ncbi:2-succinyl-6-hydroxy-2,4-cyclohexadiene-1-carboxylate synthase [Vibrio nitrifigilis]|uniref:Putative 2-succinyl-6-hydroxy-2,4-cyclohexadiene-1-carboxylate synthase n=1 Tax=Vibrio nitrifigilis TaxID=2789781 RepID=A0ABS0GB76_9VIBR|nr:2-succinyl-6-hydroxy-2,4-cyclohexadiene-1-carboxylate synthase [Vibrio nitrifigilis]MBF8999645.1 2-succinyl-6-hydroxy-2,4-cyclohexadiene-1-carboxylate synthase [Vibrio nitrifigilis]